MYLTSKKIGIASLLAPLVAIPVTLIVCIFFQLSSDLFLNRFIGLSAFAVAFLFVALIFFGTLPMLFLRRKTGKTFYVILVAIASIGILFTLLFDGHIKHAIIPTLYSGSLALAFWHLLG